MISLVEKHAIKIMIIEIILYSISIIFPWNLYNKDTGLICGTIFLVILLFFNNFIIYNLRKI